MVYKLASTSDSSVEISDNSAVTEGLAFTEVSIAEVTQPDFSESVKVLLGDGKDLFMKDPVYNISTRWVGQRTLVVIVGFLIWLGTEKLRKLKGLNLPEIVRSDLFDEGMTSLSNSEKNANDSKLLFVVSPIWVAWTIHKFMYNVNL